MNDQFDILIKFELESHWLLIEKVVPNCRELSLSMKKAVRSKTAR